MARAGGIVLGTAGNMQAKQYAVTIGKGGPSGPLGKPTLTGGGKSSRSQFKTAKSKKGYAGFMSGIGRNPKAGNHPHGPGFARRNPSVTLGPRPSLAPRTLPAKKNPGIFKRVASRARGLFGR